MDTAVDGIVDAVGASLRQRRLDQGLTLGDLTNRLGIDQAVVCRLEWGRRIGKLDRFIRVCAALGVRFSDVLRAAEDKAFPLGCAPWSNTSSNGAA
jgi:transcriptional regulator with XRE-family HTH domain